MQQNISKQLPTRLRNLTPIQLRYYHDLTRFIVNPAGRRSRKTLIGRRKVLNRSLKEVGRYFHGAPTFKQAKDIFWEKVKQDTKLFTKSKSETDLVVKLFNGSEIHVIGLDKPERIEGQEWHGCHITEFGNLKGIEVWNSNIRPVLSDTNGWALLDGVPEGRNFYYDVALRSCGGALPVSQKGLGSYAENGKEWAYYHWFSSDVLTEEEIAAVKDELDERTYRQEYEGSFESYEGLAYKEFGVHNFDSSLKEISYIISVGMDFNVDPMTATLGHIVNNEYHQFGEIWLNHSNTFEMRDELLRLFEDPTRIVIYPDSTGKAESSNANESDISILEGAKFTVEANSINPRQRDRINNVNSFIKERKDNAGKDVTRYKVNPDTCPKTVNDMNKRESLADGRLDKNQEKNQQVGHISDALGYLISYNFPIIKAGKITGIPVKGA